MLFNTVVLLAIVAVLCTKVVNAADVSGYWSENDLTKVQQQAKSIAKNSRNNNEIYHALQLLKKFGSLEDSCNCDSVIFASNSAETPLDWFFSKSNSDACGCSVSVPNQVLDGLQDSLSSSSLAEVTGGLLIGQSQGRLSSEGIEQGVNNLKQLLSVNGEIKLNSATAHLALDALAAVYSEASASSVVSEMYEAAFHMLPSGNGDNICDPTLLASLSKLTDKKVKLSSAQMQATADALVPLKYADDAETLHRAHEAMSRITAYKSAPLYVTHINSFFKYNDFDNHVLEVNVFDMLGNQVPITEVEVLSVKGSGKDTVYAEGVKSNNNRINLSEQKLNPGRYIAHLSVTVPSKTNPIKYQGYFTVVDKVTVSKVHAGVTDGKVASTGDLKSISTPNAFSGSSASAVALEVVHVKYVVSPAHEFEKAKKPHQSFVRLTDVKSGSSLVFPAKRSGDGPDFEYSAAIAIAEEVENFNYASGTYTISVLVGDASFSEPLEWMVGSVDLKFPNKPLVNYPLYAKSLLYTSDNTLSALPEIEHQMRPPAKRASDFMAGTFTILTIIPLLVFIVFNLSLKPNFAYLRSITSIAFVTCLAGTLVLYSGYWLAIEGLSFYKTIKYLGFSLPVTLILGYYSLQSVIKTREAKQK